MPRNKIIGFSESSWIAEVKNLVLIGPSGVGKSHLASALCYSTIQQGIPAAFISCFDLVNKLKHSKNKPAMMQYYGTIKVLCIDELGYVFPDQSEANDIFQIISKRSEIAPTIVTTNLLPSQWGKIFEAATATAILDRLSLNGTFMTCEGKSYRSRK
jgi:DNA replication protein DnaC